MGVQTWAEQDRHIVPIERKHLIHQSACKRVVITPEKINRAVGWSSVVPQLVEEDPPGAEHGACKHENGSHDDNDNKRLSYRSIESAQGSSRPIHPICGEAMR